VIATVSESSGCLHRHSRRANRTIVPPFRLLTGGVQAHACLDSPKISSARCRGRLSGSSSAAPHRETLHANVGREPVAPRHQRERLELLGGFDCASSCNSGSDHRKREPSRTSIRVPHRNNITHLAAPRLAPGSEFYSRSRAGLSRGSNRAARTSAPHREEPNAGAPRAVRQPLACRPTRSSGALLSGCSLRQVEAVVSVGSSRLLRSAAL
jgi:hypothetical protein